MRRDAERKFLIILIISVQKKRVRCDDFHFLGRLSRHIFLPPSMMKKVNRCFVDDKLESCRHQGVLHHVCRVQRHHVAVNTPVSSAEAVTAIQTTVSTTPYYCALRTTFGAKSRSYRRIFLPNFPHFIFRAIFGISVLRPSFAKLI